MHYAGNNAKADETVAAITASGGTADMSAAFDAVNTAAIMILSPIATLDLADLDRRGKDDAAIASFARATPLERLGQPADIAEAVSFLAGPGRWVNGQVIYTNGGLA